MKGADGVARLARALVADARAAGVTATVETASERPWASVTYSGARHRLTLTAGDAPGLAGWIAALPEAELAVRGHLVADLVVEAVTVADGVATVVTEVLTLVED